MTNRIVLCFGSIPLDVLGVVLAGLSRVLMWETFRVGVDARSLIAGETDLLAFELAEVAESVLDLKAT